MNIELLHYFSKVPEGYIGFVEELPANTADTLEERAPTYRSSYPGASLAAGRRVVTGKDIIL